jgi:hypothetical protein
VTRVAAYCSGGGGGGVLDRVKLWGVIIFF